MSRQYEAYTDDRLAFAIGEVSADMALAEKYEHNAHLRPAIRRHLDALLAEQRLRQLSAPPPDTHICGGSWDKMPITSRQEVWSFYDRLAERRPADAQETPE